MPNNHKIIIERALNGNQLQMSDMGKTKVKKKDTVVWELDGGSGIEKIVAIQYKDPEKNVFAREPAEVPGTTNWEGTIMDKDIKEDIDEEYYIQFIKVGKQGIYTYDPIIQMNP